MIRILLLDRSGVPVAGGRCAAQELPKSFVYTLVTFQLIETLALPQNVKLAVYQMVGA